MKTCPHCGAELHERSSFCPYCAKTVNPRAKAIQPWYIPRLTLYSVSLFLFLVVLAGALVLWLGSRPKTYESDTGELLYTSHGESFRLCLSTTEPPEPIPENHFHSELNYAYRNPTPLYAVSPEEGSLLADEFMANVASITAEAHCSDASLTITCTEPQPHDEFFPNAAAVTFVDFSLLAPGDFEAEVAYTITMKTGDVIRMTQRQRYTSISTYTYTAEDVPMDTIEDLQALVDSLTERIDEYDRAVLYLPAMVYEGGLTVNERAVSLYGSVGSDGQRTTFTGPVVSSFRRGIREFHDISFRGNGAGAGVTAAGASRVHLIDCRVSGWETGFLAVDNAWINAVGTTFTDNAVGLRFDAADTPMVSDNFFVGDSFQNNGTAVLLERVPADVPLEFPETRFTGNGTDIDNRCNQSLDISEAIFE